LVISLPGSTALRAGSFNIQVKTRVSGALSNLAPMPMFKPDPMESTYIRRRSWN